jgi:serine/threonine-protein kinase
MTSASRWRRIEELYHAALERPESQRPAFLRAACDDEAMSREVESLLAEGAAEQFLAMPAIELAAREMAGSRDALIGRHLGPYEILSILGVGGMGVVYRARDTKLQREVAIKVLPHAVATDPDCVARFAREARLLAALNHPHIATVYGLEEVDGFFGLVMELVEGETLAERLAGGPLASAEAIGLAKQLVDGLEAAHDSGMIHCDLKPSNIKLRADGTVKILDFGLAKILASAPETSNTGLVRRPSQTRLGVVTGTPAYMSPEQAQGYPVDRRTDVWAFGCVCYEMLTGKQAFAGANIGETVAAVLGAEPSWEALPRDLSPSVLLFLMRCLAKDVKQRVSDVHMMRLALDGAFETPVVATAPSVGGTNRGWQRVRPMLGVAVVVSLITGLAAWAVMRTSGVTPLVSASGVTRSLLAVHPFGEPRPAGIASNYQSVLPSETGVALSPDGHVLVFQALGKDGAWQLHLRTLSSLNATPIPGTQGGRSPFFSPDGAWLGFWADGELKKVPLAGGPVTTICRVQGPARQIHGASWGTGDVIVFATTFARGGGLWRVSALGGEPVALSNPGPDEFAYRLPHMLPGGNAVLFTIARAAFRWDDAQIAVRSLATGEQKILLKDGADARYASSGHLVFARRGTVMAAPFDPSRLELTGAPVALVEGVMHSINQLNLGTDSGAAHFSVSNRGALVYATGGIRPDPRRMLVWMDRNGSREPLPIPPGTYLGPRLAPVGKRVAVFTGLSRASRVWTLDLETGAMTPVTTADERASQNVWAPHGDRIAFNSQAQRGLFWKNADGTGIAERLTQSNYLHEPSAWSPDGKVLAFVENHPTTGPDIWGIDVSGSDRLPKPIVATASAERHPAFSSDGQWLAYSSNDSGRSEVYVQPFPGPGRRVPISTDSGSSPAWRADGKELYYVKQHVVGGEDRFRIGGPATVSVMAVRVHAGREGFSVGAPRKLFEGPFVVGSGHSYDVTPDGQRFLMVEVLEPLPEPATELILVTNWFEELRRLVPTK